MPYIGTPAVDRFTSTKAASVFSGDGSTTAFTLDHAVGSDEDILVSVDGVIQEPSVAYAVSNGTTLTFTGAPSSNSGNNIFVYYLFRTVGTVGHPSNQALSATNGTFTGNVGIGTTSPAVALETSGDMAVSDTSTASKRLQLSAGASEHTINSANYGSDMMDLNIQAENTIFKNGLIGVVESMKIDSAGHITKPLQTAFSANLGGTNSSTLATDGSALTLSFNTERFDQNADFASNTFTAPITGKYVLALHLRIDSVDTAATYYIPTILTSNQAYRTVINPKFASDVAYLGMTTTVVADMDASDTATVTIQQSGGSAQSNVEGTNDYTYFTGYLLG